MQRDQQTVSSVKGAAWGGAGVWSRDHRVGTSRSSLSLPGLLCETFMVHQEPCPQRGGGVSPPPPAPTLRHPQPGVFSVGVRAPGVTRRGFLGVVARQAPEVWVSFTACGGGRWAGPAGPGQMPPSVWHCRLGPLRCPQHLPPGTQEDRLTRSFSPGRERGPSEGQGVLPGALPPWSPEGLAQRLGQDCRLARRGQSMALAKESGQALTEDTTAGMGRRSDGPRSMAVGAPPV